MTDAYIQGLSTSTVRASLTAGVWFVPRRRLFRTVGLAATPPPPTSRRASRKGSSQMASKAAGRAASMNRSCCRTARKLRTLARAWLAKGVPKSDHKMEKVQTAAHCVTRAAGQGGADDLRRDGDAAGGPSVASARLQFRSQRPTLGSAEAEARYVMAPYL